jgi:fucose permease
MFPFGHSFGYFLVLLLATGVAIGLFKTAALALIGDISEHPKEHTQTMNIAEGFFGIGAIIGPALVTYMINDGISWVYLYAIAGASAVALMIIASFTRYPSRPDINREHINWRSSLRMMRDPYCLGFSTAIALYVVVEAGIYVWMPTLLLDYQGSYVWLATYALSIFFIFRAAGRFLGAWILSFVRWQTAILLFTGLIFSCYLFSTLLGLNAAVWLLPASGLFMSIIYPTLNSKGISCFDSHEHGAIAGVILFFTAAAAALGPLLMGLIGDLFGHVHYGFTFAMVCAGGLFALAIWNALRDPSANRLLSINAPIVPAR